MSQTAAHLVDHVIPHVPVRQWVLSLPIPLRLLLAAQPELVTPVLQVVQRVVTRHLLGGADGAPSFVEVAAPTDDELHALLQTVITRLMKMLTRRGVLVEDMGQTYLAEPDATSEEARTLRLLQTAAVTYRIAFGPSAGQDADPQGRDAARDSGTPATVCRHRRFQPARRGTGGGT